MLLPLKRAAATLRDNGIRYCLAGGVSVWARGGPVSDHDIDFLIKPEDTDRALELLEEAGFRAEHPPEGWLVKVIDGDVVIDLIHHPTGMVVTDEVLDRAEEMNVHAMPMPVQRPEDFFVTRLLALTEQEINYEGLLESARALREQVDWEDVRSRTGESVFAAAFFTLAEGLGIIT